MPIEDEGPLVYALGSVLMRVVASVELMELERVGVGRCPRRSIMLGLGCLSFDDGLGIACCVMTVPTLFARLDFFFTCSSSSSSGLYFSLSLTAFFLAVPLTPGARLRVGLMVVSIAVFGLAPLLLVVVDLLLAGVG